MAALLNNFIPFVFLAFFFQSSEAYYTSSKLKSVELISVEGAAYSIIDDDDAVVSIEEKQDQNGIIYWYRRLETPVCLTGTCKLIDVGIFWDFKGDFFGLEVYGEDLTKTDHSVFKEEDYNKLISILNDDWSMLREYEFSDLLSEEEVDGVSGATREELASEVVDDAVYTTYTLWHLAHLGEKEKLIDLTLSQLNKNDELLHAIIGAQEESYDYFILDQVIEQKIAFSEKVQLLVMSGITSDKRVFRKKAMDALKQCNLSDHSIQRTLSGVYEESTIEEKLKILDALTGVAPGDELTDSLIKDCELNNEWFLIRLLEVLSNGSGHKEQINALQDRLVKSEISEIRELALKIQIEPVIKP